MTAGQRQLVGLKQWAVSEHLNDLMTPQEIAGVLGVEEREVEEAIEEHLQHVAECAGEVA